MPFAIYLNACRLYFSFFKSYLRPTDKMIRVRKKFLNNQVAKEKKYKERKKRNTMVRENQVAKEKEEKEIQW